MIFQQLYFSFENITRDLTVSAAKKPSKSLLGIALQFVKSKATILQTLFRYTINWKKEKVLNTIYIEIRFVFIFNLTYVQNYVYKWSI